MTIKVDKPNNLPIQQMYMKDMSSRPILIVEFHIIS